MTTEGFGLLHMTPSAPDDGDTSPARTPREGGGQTATVFPLNVQRSATTQLGHIGVRALQV